MPPERRPAGREVNSVNPANLSNSEMLDFCCLRGMPCKSAKKCIFSITVISAGKVNCWAMYPLRSRISYTSRIESKPSTLLAPASRFSNPKMTRVVVLFPAPSGPIRPKVSPRSTSNETESTALIVLPCALKTLTRAWVEMAVSEDMLVNPISSSI